MNHFSKYTRMLLRLAHTNSLTSTLRKSQYLSERFRVSHDTGRPLLEKLNDWYSSLPESFRLPNWSKSVSGLAPYPTSIHFAYLILVLFVYRALLRPMARSSSPPLIFDLDEIPTNPSALDTAVDDSPVLDFLNMPEIDSFPAVELSDHSTGETTLNSAERCASIVISFTRRLTSSDFTGFWYSCKFTLLPNHPYWWILIKGSVQGLASASQPSPTSPFSS